MERNLSTKEPLVTGKTEYITATLGFISQAGLVATHSSFTAYMGTLLQTPGVYTVVVWRGTGGTWLEEALVQLSVFVG